MAFRFRNFKVYDNIKQFVKEIYISTNCFPKSELFGLTSQVRRAAVSISLNIAEGSDRGTDKEFCRFIFIAMGSTNEVVAALDLALNYLKKEDYGSLIIKAEIIIKQLSSFIKSLKACRKPLAVSQYISKCKP